MSQSNPYKRVSYTKLDANKIELENLLEGNDDEFKKKQKQYTGYCRYEGSQLVVQSPPIKIDWGGIPGPKDQIYETDYDKSKNVHIPLSVNPDTKNETQEESEVREESLKKFKALVIDAIDIYMESAEGKDALFGNKKKSYKYSKILKTPKKKEENDDDSDDDEPKKVYYKPEHYFKSRIPFEWDKEEKKFTTKVKTSVIIINDDKESEEYKADGKYTTVKVETLDDLRKYLRYMSTVRIQFHLAKVWANKTKTTMDGVSAKLYGLVWKINRILINRSQMKSKGGNSQEDVYEVPSDDEDEEDAVKTVMKSKNDDDEEEATVLSDSDEEAGNGSSNDSEENSEETEASPEQIPRRGRRGRKAA